MAITTYHYGVCHAESPEPWGTSSRAAFPSRERGRPVVAPAPRWRLGLGLNTMVQIGVVAVPSINKRASLHCSQSGGTYAGSRAEPAD
jgi:hypothetical protein